MTIRSKQYNQFGSIQPGTHIDTVHELTAEEFVRTSVPHADDLVTRRKIQLAYPAVSVSGNITNNLDALHEERLASVEQSECSDIRWLVTVDVVHGDCFRFTYATGLWMFVGTHVLDDQTMLFVPADEAARNSPVYPAYRTMLRADFVAKLAGHRGTTTIERVHPTEADNPSALALPGEPETGHQSAITRFRRRIAEIIAPN